MIRGTFFMSAKGDEYVSVFDKGSETKCHAGRFGGMELN